MDSCGKRLGIALTTVVIALGLNVVAVVSGVAEHTYGYLLETRPVPASNTWMRE
jgi:hypothetical protein